MSPSPQANSPQTSTEDIEKYKEIIRSNGITDEVAEVIEKDGGSQGEGFVSLTKRVTVKFTNPLVKDINLFVKTHTTNDSHTEMIDDLRAFEKEAVFLTKYVSAAQEFCKSKGLDDFVNFYPKCYYGDDKIIVLENLVMEGYEMLRKEDMQDFESAKWSLKTLAKHHALSYAMIQEAGGAKKFFERFPGLDHEGMNTPKFLEMFFGAINEAVAGNIRILEKYDVGAKESAKKLEKLLNKKPHELFVKALECDPEKEQLVLLGHGDYWNNNMMFKKDPATGKIVSQVAIDFQVTRYNIPVLDLSYYIFCSVKSAVRVAHLHDLLEHYLTNLKELAEMLGHPIELTQERLFHDFRRKLDFGFWPGQTYVSGPAMSVCSEIDLTAYDVKDWGKVFDDAINEYFKEHPEVAIFTANEIVTSVKEYEALTLNQ